jgi:Hemerythrin HHE cation binding domain
MNSIYLQCPHVTNHTDIADLLFYTKTLVITINAHHDSEEKYLFPDLATYTKNPKIMAVNQAQHAAFHSGMEKLGEYCTTTSTADYSSATFRAMIDSFAPQLFKHLNEEIPTILALKQYPSEDLKPIWAKTEKHINDVGSFDEMFPLAFGCMDKGFEAGQHKFPPVPRIMNYVVKYWFARKHSGAWRFNPCDMRGNPRPLLFLPKEEDEKP